MNDKAMVRFLVESLGIEGIHRMPTEAEITATRAFIEGDGRIGSLIALQAVYAPGKPLRDKVGMNVRVGGHIAPPGCPGITARLIAIIAEPDPWKQHVWFEHLHPFMDGNGRTGRALWARTMFECGHDPFALPFLHRFYYQTLSANDRWDAA